MALTSHDREDADRVTDFIKGIQDSNQEERKRAVEHTAVILGSVAAWRAYKKYKRGTK